MKGISNLITFLIVTNLVNEGNSGNVMDLDLSKALMLHDNLLHEILLENIDSNLL